MADNYTIQIYQMPVENDKCFRRYDEKLKPTIEDYDLVYEMSVPKEVVDKNRMAYLEKLYIQLNTNHPSDYKARSLSVSDAVVVSDGKESKAYFVDSFGYKKLSDFEAVFDTKKQVKKEIEK